MFQNHFRYFRFIITGLQRNFRSKWSNEIYQNQLLKYLTNIYFVYFRLQFPVVMESTIIILIKPQKTQFWPFPFFRNFRNFFFVFLVLFFIEFFRFCSLNLLYFYFFYFVSFIGIIFCLIIFSVYFHFNIFCFVIYFFYCSFYFCIYFNLFLNYFL